MALKRPQTALDWEAIPEPHCRLGPPGVTTCAGAMAAVGPAGLLCEGTGLDHGLG